MVPEMEKPRVTEIRVRMDCNGCVQKIKKALHGITGIYDVYIDYPQQKITVMGWVEPHKIVKAIKKTRKGAIICSHTEQSDPPVQETEASPEAGKTEGGQAPPKSEAEQPPAEEELSPPPEKKLTPEPVNGITQPPKPTYAEQIHIVYHHPPEFGYRYAAYGGQYNQHGVGGQWNTNPTGPGVGGQRNTNPIGPGLGGEPSQPIHVTHSYNAYKPSPYVTEFMHLHSSPEYTHYSRPHQVYYSGNNVNGNVNGNITSMFSEENPNACSIV